MFDPRDIRILMRAEDVPSGGKVTKRGGGDVDYVLARNVSVVPEMAKDSKSITLPGLFLVGKTTGIASVSPDAMLLWRTTLEELIEFSRRRA